MNFEHYKTLLDLQREWHVRKGGEEEISVLEELETLTRNIMADGDSTEHDVLRLEQSRTAYLTHLVKIATGKARAGWLEQLTELLDQQYERYSVDFEHPSQRARLISMRRFQQFSNRIFDLDEETVASHPTLQRYAQVNRDIKGRMFWDRSWSDNTIES